MRHRPRNHRPRRTDEDDGIARGLQRDAPAGPVGPRQDRSVGIDARETSIDLLALTLGASALFLVALGARDLWNPNEPIYGRAVVEMAMRGDWLVPTVNGGAFAEKPILYYWLALAFSKVFGGVNELTLRLPSVFAGVSAVAFTYLLVLPYSSRRRALLAGALLATQYLVWWSSRSVQMDVLILASTVAVLLPLTRMIDFDLSPARAWALAGLAAGSGFIAKGPVAWAIPGLAFVSFVALRRLPPSRWAIGLGWGVAFAMVIAAPWYVALWASGNAGLIEELLLRQNFSRFIDAWDHYRHPWHYYSTYVLVDYLPWSLFVPIAIGLPRGANERRLQSLAWVWLISTVVFFSLADSKRAPYILAIAPAIAILASGVHDRLVEGSLSRNRRRACLAIAGFLAGTLGLLAIALIVERERFHADLAPVSVAAAAGVAVAATILATASWYSSRRPRTMPLAIVTAMVVLYTTAALALPAADVIKSARPWALRLEEIVGPEGNLVSFGFDRWRAGYPFYAERSIPNYFDLEEMVEVWRDEDVYVLVEKKWVDEVRAALGDLEPIMEHSFVDRVAYLFPMSSAVAP